MGLKKKRDNIISKIEVDNLIQDMETLELQAMVSFLYLTGCRISEALRFDKKNLWDEDGYIFFRLVTLKQKTTQGITPNRIIKIKRGTTYLYYILEYAQTITEGLLFSKTRQYYWIKVDKSNKKVWLHLFRETRASRFGEANATDQQLMRWFGWTTTTMPYRYTRKATGMIDKLADNVE